MTVQTYVYSMKIAGLLRPWCTNFPVLWRYVYIPYVPNHKRWIKAVAVRFITIFCKSHFATTAKETSEKRSPICFV